QCDYLASNYNPGYRGLVRQIHPRKIGDIRNGTSCTLVAGEKQMDLRTLDTLTANGDQGYAAGWDGDTVGRTDEQPQPDTVTGMPGSPNRPFFGSSHPSRFNTVFVDGSVRPVSYNIRLDVFKAIGDISTNQVISSSAF